MYCGVMVQPEILSPTGESKLGEYDVVPKPVLRGLINSYQVNETQHVIKTFPNGDAYVGTWVDGVPHKVGRYCWADGSTYEGEWEKGVKHGKGLFVWPSKARYLGEWISGTMQGVGSYWAEDGSFYTGNWMKGVKQGIGRKKYPNGDSYEGFWKKGVAHGPGRYAWENGCEYVGEWQYGLMSGSGTFTWSNGDMYEGDWEDGYEHGYGKFTWADGSVFDGNWSKGLKDGCGVYVPAGVSLLANFLSDDESQSEKQSRATQLHVSRPVSMDGSSLLEGEHGDRVEALKTLSRGFSLNFDRNVRRSIESRLSRGAKDLEAKLEAQSTELCPAKYFATYEIKSVSFPSSRDAHLPHTPKFGSKNLNEISESSKNRDEEETEHSKLVEVKEEEEVVNVVSIAEKEEKETSVLIQKIDDVNDNHSTPVKEGRRRRSLSDGVDESSVLKWWDSLHFGSHGKLADRKSTEDQIESTEDRAESREDQVGSIEDQVGSTEDQVGSTEDQVGSTEDQVGSREDHVESTDDSETLKNSNASDLRVLNETKINGKDETNEFTLSHHSRERNLSDLSSLSSDSQLETSETSSFILSSNDELNALNSSSASHELDLNEIQSQTSNEISHSKSTDDAKEKDASFREDQPSVSRKEETISGENEIEKEKEKEEEEKNEKEKEEEKENAKEKEEVDVFIDKNKMDERNKFTPSGAFSSPDVKALYAKYRKNFTKLPTFPSSSSSPSSFPPDSVDSTDTSTSTSNISNTQNLNSVSMNISPMNVPPRPSDEAGLLFSGPIFNNKNAKYRPSGNFSYDEKKTVVLREYVQGVLVSESLYSSKSNFPKRKIPKKLGLRPGETIFKGHRSYDLMLILQLGIRYSVGKISTASLREVREGDFSSGANIAVRFPPEGSTITPPHHMQSFKWRDYCPVVFRELRRMFHIDPSEYMLSLCGNDALRELSSPGKSGSVFYLSNDDRFIIKTMKRSEVQVLLRMLPSYYNHIKRNKNTLLTKFFGLHRVKIHLGRRVRFVVMGNLFQTDLRIHRRFDLKGSTHGRSTDKIEINETTTLKDLDLDLAFHLHPALHHVVMKQIEEDSKFLESQRIMDYSLLLGLHFCATNPPLPIVSSDLKLKLEAIDSPNTSTVVPMSSSSFSSSSSPKATQESSNKGRKNSKSNFMSLFYKAKSAQGSNSDFVLDSDLEVANEPKLEIGQGMSAIAVRLDKRTLLPIYDPQTAEAYDVILFFGIIDILQEYDVGKKLEHFCKSIQYDGGTISSVDPHLYATRFFQFSKATFPDPLASPMAEIVPESQDLRNDPRKSPLRRA